MLYAVFFVAGGRGIDGAPIIIFPEYSGFNEVPEEDFLNVVTYLTSIPRYTHSQTHSTLFSLRLSLYKQGLIPQVTR